MLSTTCSGINHAVSAITSSKELINSRILKKPESINKSQGQENSSTHQRTMSPAPTPVQNTVVVDSEANTVVVDSETESESEIESHPDNELDFYVENQLGLPSPPFEPDPTIPPFDPTTISNDLNSNSESFPKEWFDFTVCQTACKVQVNETEGNEFEVMETNIEVSLVRRSLSTSMSIRC
jgi:hypothetical protein